MQDPLAFRVMNEIGIIDQLGTTLFERSMPHGLTLPQFIVLNHFARLGGDRSPVELAAALQVSKATMSSTLQKLESKGFVTSVPDPKDGRGKRIAITPAGRQGRDDAVKAISPELGAMEAAIGTETLGAALPFLMALRTYLDQRRAIP